MLPVPAVDKRMRRLIGERDIETVWFGAAAPLALLGPSARRAGVARVLASTHGHEVGWSMLPGARSALRRIGDGTDVVTYVSRYTRSRFAAAFGPATPPWSTCRQASTPTGSGRTRRRVRNCVPATDWVTAPRSSACHGWCRARGRTC